MRNIEPPARFVKFKTSEELKDLAVEVDKSFYILLLGWGILLADAGKVVDLYSEEYGGANGGIDMGGFEECYNSLKEGIAEEYPEEKYPEYYL